MDLPVVLDIVVPTGELRRVTLVGLGEERVTLVIGGREYTFPLNEVERLWDGSFILVWKAPPIRSRLISRGMQGGEVEWVRRQLDAVDGAVSRGGSPDVYDAELEGRVMAFQRSRSLLPDGLVGGETLLHLTLAKREPGVPSLSSRVR